MPLIAGTRLGPYEIGHPIGAGGMGEVYRARDSRLQRDVALKLLPEIFAADHDRVMRFQREAQTLAALNHPRIAQIYGVIDQPLGLVMELVDSQDLSERIAADRIRGGSPSRPGRPSRLSMRKPVHGHPSRCRCPQATAIASHLMDGRC